jgi:hypothetical protein
MSDEEHDEDEERAAPVEDAAVRAALRELRVAEDVTVRNILLLVAASLERKATFVPQAVIDAALAKWETDADFDNGGADQFAWNHGADGTRAVAAAFRGVGAIENADLLDRLASELDAHRAGIGDAPPAPDTVRDFLAYRRRVGGPYFQVPEPADELSEVLIEYVIEHAAELADPDLPLPPPTDQ